jgi:hypothetical protein
VVGFLIIEVDNKNYDYSKMIINIKYKAREGMESFNPLEHVDSQLTIACKY